MRRLILLTAIIGFVLITSQAQDGRGLIRYGVLNDFDTGFTSFNPLLCDDSACSWATELLFPTLLATDYDTGWYTAGTQENNAMALDWTISADNRIYTFQLRDDAFWSDGTPITAYDYFYAYLMADNRITQNSYLRGLAINGIEGVVPLNNSELAVIMPYPVCDRLPYLDLPFIPAHVFDEVFTANAAVFFANGGDIDTLWSAWDESFDYDFSFMLNHPFNAYPSVTGDYFHFVDYDHREHIRLQRGDVAFEIVPVSSISEMLDRFLSSDLNVIPYLPPERIADFATNPDVQLFESSTSSFDYIAFNLADPREPMDAFDDDGNALEQGEHPILGNINIRQAIQLGIDSQNVLDVALHGQGSVIPANTAPSSWIHNEELAAFAYNPDEAERLLNEAGWVQVGNRQIRECVHCEVVPDGTSLSLSLGYSNSRHYPVAAIVIQQQLRSIGIEISSYPSDLSQIREQRFDLFLSAWFDDYPTSPDWDILFTPEADVLGSGYNFMSYNQPEVTHLIEEAQTVQGCDLAERQALYTEAQAIIQQDLPYVWLYSENWTTAIRADIQNVDVRTYTPFWTLDDWVVFDAP